MPTVSLSELLNSTNQLGYTGSRGSFDGVTDQAVLISNATPSDNTVSGALQVAGGVGISGNVYVGQELYVTGNILPTSNNTVNIGSPTQRFGTVYLSANSVDIGGAVISTSNQGDLSFATTTGTIDLNANSVSFLSNVAQGTVGQTGYTGSRGTDGVIGVDGYTGSIGYTGSTSEATTVTVSPVFKGALLAVNGTMNLPAATYTTVTTLGTVVYDTDNFASVSNRLTIPAGVSKVKLSATMIGASQTEQFILIIIKNGQTTYTSAHDGDTGGADGVVAITPVIPVVAGDYFQLQAYSTLARTTSATPETSWFAIEVVEGSMLDTTSVIRTTGYTGSAGVDGVIGFTGSAGTGGGTSEKFVSLVQDGTLRVVNGISRWYPPVAVTVNKIIARVDQAPIGASLNIRINKVSATTSTVVMSIAAGSLKSENSTPAMSLDPDDYLTVDITQIGASVAGRSLRVTFVYE